MTGSSANVLFVCFGNICRSPLGEALFRHLVEEAGLGERIRVDSAGTCAWKTDSPPHPEVVRILDRRGLDSSLLKTRMVLSRDLDLFDWVLAMDRENLRDLESMGPARGHRELLLRYAPAVERLDVPDPFVEGGFEHVADLIEQGCHGLFEAVRAELEADEL